MAFRKQTFRNKSCTFVSCSFVVGNMNLGVRPGTVGRKKGAAGGAAGGATGLFLLYKQHEQHSLEYSFNIKHRVRPVSIMDDLNSP